MEIRYFGHSCFLLSGDYKVLTDPFSGIGYEMLTVRADFALLSHGHYDHNAKEKAIGAKIIENGLAEAPEIKLDKIACFHDEVDGKKRGANTAYIFEVNQIRFCHLGDVGEAVSDKFATLCGEVDVLFIPVGGKYTINAKEALGYVEYIKPKIVIPMHFKTPKSNISISGVDEFLDTMQYSVLRKSESFNISKDSLPNDTTVYVCSFDGF